MNISIHIQYIYMYIHIMLGILINKLRCFNVVKLMLFNGYINIVVYNSIIIG